MEIYERLDQLQNETFAQLDALVQTIDLKEEAEYSKASTKILSKIHQKLLAFKDYLRILKLNNSKTVNTSTYQIYELKYKSLKSKLKYLEIYINDTQDKNLQQWRLQHFNLFQPTADEELSESQMRDKLFSNRAAQKTNEASIAQQIHDQNTKITSSLQTSRDLLSASILQSELNIDSIDQQTKDLAKLNENFIQFGDLLNKSRGIIKFIEKQDKQDRQRIYLSIGFFLLCCIWVIYRRVLRRPIRILLWSFFKIFNIFGWILSGFKTKRDFDGVKQELITATMIATTAATDLLSTITDTSSTTTELTSIATTIEKLSEILEETISTLVTDRLVDEL
ncbi:SEC20 [Candida jiufengensis]|uniref:SEC20 n=1 Tax=Candida jiufengensis TaxID=497108 RepID=UPI0022249BED|nr:SEC20 [Candida jiufengensis]KAI5956907.1 SEC20 [Candida jiufengensis]